MTLLLPQSDQLRRVSLPCHALIDPFLHDPMRVTIEPGVSSMDGLRMARERAWDRAVSVAEETVSPLEMAQLPYMVTLEHGDPLQDHVMDIARAEMAYADAHPTAAALYSSGTFIESSLPPDVLMQRVQRMWARSSPHMRYLRIAQPRVFELLVHTLPLADLSRWLGPIARWHFFTRNGRWQTLLGACDESLLEKEEDCFRRDRLLQDLASEPPRLHLDPLARHRLVMHSEAVSRVLDSLKRDRDSFDFTADVFAQAWTAADEAGALAMAHMDDQVTAVRYLMRHPHALNSRVLREAAVQARHRPGQLEKFLNASLTGSSAETHTP